MNLLAAVQPYLLSPHDSVNPDDRDCYRLTVDDKQSLEMAILVNGAGAIANVTKGGAMLYLRSAMRFSGEDEIYLRSLFAPDTVPDLPWDGPDHIVVSQRSSSSAVVVGREIKIVETYSPFEERFLRLPYAPMVQADDAIIGYEFCATMQCRNTLRILQQHGRLEALTPECLPKIFEEQWQGIWVPVTRLRKAFSKGATMASEIGQIPRDGGDYLRFLLTVKTIGAMDIDFRAKSKLLEEIPYMRGQDGTSFGELEGRSPRSLVGIMETEFEYDDEEGEHEDD